MEFSELDLTLAWPKELFSWESHRIQRLQNRASFPDMVEALLVEAFADNDVADSVMRIKDPFELGEDTQRRQAAEILEELIVNQDSLQEFQPKQYWLERTGNVEALSEQEPFTEAFARLSHEFRDAGYFPKFDPEFCVDGNSLELPNPSIAISRAIHAEVDWPLDGKFDSKPENVVFSVIEYLHDQAQRPRTRSFHSYSNCGWHFDNHNKESGGVIYRWRVNQLLKKYEYDWRLGNQGVEKGRLIRCSDVGLEDLATELSANPSNIDEETVANAIQRYRSRHSTIHDRRSAISQLAGYLEKHRQELKDSALAKNDESDLFNIFNNYSIRHNNRAQKGDYGDEYLDWLYWSTLAAIQLLKSVQARNE